MFICPNCDNDIGNDEQLIIFGTTENSFQVDHVKIFSEGSTQVKIEKVCSPSRVYTECSIN